MNPLSWLKQIIYIYIYIYMCMFVIYCNCCNDNVWLYIYIYIYIYIYTHIYIYITTHYHYNNYSKLQTSLPIVYVCCLCTFAGVLRTISTWEMKWLTGTYSGR